VGVVGLGTMGAGIAQVCMQAGVETVGREVSAELCERARMRAEHYLGGVGGRALHTTLRNKRLLVARISPNCGKFALHLDPG
jgi:3-hydroxyacyl-CoA dehydrogenase